MIVMILVQIARYLFPVIIIIIIVANPPEIGISTGRTAPAPAGPGSGPELELRLQRCFSDALNETESLNPSRQNIPQGHLLPSSQTGRQTALLIDSPRGNLLIESQESQDNH